MKIREVALPVALIMVIGSLLVPVPLIVLDLLIITNLLFALGLVGLALQSTDSLKLSALPTILLLSTLFRLCINVSTSRLILSQGQGGEMIEAFGSFVLQGNIGVGVILFLMLTLIQFIVIAKGSERVAEVAARFTLDALPGKQMAIDADVRSGIYDMQTARQKRNELQTESRFYGALDGSMKFIKGDAIAGICIVVINILGGIVAGIISGLSLSEAAHLYTILTVGDGLASQIPALLNSLAAGLVVTRVGQKEDISLSSEMIEQILQSKSVLMLAGITAMTLGFIPGMPPMPLISIGMVFLIGCFFYRPKKEHALSLLEKEFQPSQIALLEIVLQLSPVTQPSITAAVLKAVKTHIEHTRERFFDGTGILLPHFSLTKNDHDDSVDYFIVCKLRGTRILCSYINLDNLTLEEDVQKFFVELTEVLKNMREDLLDDAHSKRLLDWYEIYQPELVGGVLNNNIITITQFTELLKGLASENLPLYPLDRLMQGILEMAPKVGSDRALIDEIRPYLKRTIHEKLFGLKKTINAALVDQSLESELLFGDGNKEVMDPLIVSRLVDYIKTIQTDIDAVIASKSARRLLAEVLIMYQVKPPVVSHSEILNDVVINPIATLSKDLILEINQENIKGQNNVHEFMQH